MKRFIDLVYQTRIERRETQTNMLATT